MFTRAFFPRAYFAEVYFEPVEGGIPGPVSGFVIWIMEP